MELSFASVVFLLVLSAVLILTWRVLNWVWLKPKKLEAALRKQGISGTDYTFLFGDLKKNAKMVAEAKSKPINFSDDISLRIMPFFSQAVKNHGKTSFTWFGPTPRLTIMNPEQIKEIFNKSDDFKKARFNPLFKLIAPGLVTYDGEKWAKHRKIINPAFHVEKLKNMVPAFQESCSEMISKWEEKISDDGLACEVDVWPYLTNLTGDVISRTAFGSCYEEGKRIFQLQDELARLTIQAVQSVYIPGWRFVPTKMHRRMKSIDKEMADILKGIIRKKETAMRAGEAQNDDLLGILLESNTGQDRGSSMSIKDVIDECKLFYFAGQETTSVLLVWTMVMLSHHRDWQTRAREEVLLVFGKNKPDFEGLSHLKVVTMILHEVLRLYPSAVLLTRAAYKDLKLGDLTIPAGVILSVPIILVQRDRELWGEDALEFKPDRFADGVSRATKNRVSFLPFGWGPRICIGQNFAMLEAKMAMVLMLQRFSFKLSPSYAHAPYTVITLHPQFGAHLMLQKI